MYKESQQWKLNKNQMMHKTINKSLNVLTPNVFDLRYQMLLT
jgi:hypothetical protein